MRHTIFLFFSLFITCLLLFSCKENENKSNLKGKAVVLDKGQQIPGVPQDLIEKLLDECTGIDYIFDNWPVSMSQDEDASIDQNIMFIDFKRLVGHIPPNCKKEGRKFMKMGAEEAYMVDFYFGENCNFYVFRDKQNKPLYANYMTNAGVNFYQNIFAQVQGAVKTQ